MEQPRKLLIIGDSAFAEIAYEYFTHDSDYEVVAFCVERAYLKRTELFGLPVVAFEDVEEAFAPQQHAFYAANVYTKLNRLRARLYEAAKAKGYTPASYISRFADVQPHVALGEHCFVFENNLLQSHASLGDNVVLWSGNQIGRGAVVGSHTFIASHAVVEYGATVGTSCFIGVNATIRSGIKLGDDCIVGAGAFVGDDIPDDKVVRGEVNAAVEGARRTCGVDREN